MDSHPDHYWRVKRLYLWAKISLASKDGVSARAVDCEDCKGLIKLDL